MIDLTIFLQAASPEGFANGNIIQMVLWMAILLILYFFILRPGTQKAKKERAYFDSIRNGDKIVTKSGIHGKVVKVSEKTVIIQVADNVKLKIERSALSPDLSSIPDADA